MTSSLNINISWGAVAVLVTMVLAYLGTVGTLVWKLYAHVGDNSKHLTGQELVTAGVCEATSQSIQRELEETRKYVGDSEVRMTKRLEDIHECLKELIAKN